MADTISSEYSLKMDLQFVDGDTRALTLENPKIGLTMSDVEVFETFLKNNPVLIGDKTGASFKGLDDSPQLVTVTRRKIDLT